MGRKSSRGLLLAGCSLSLILAAQAVAQTTSGPRNGASSNAGPQPMVVTGAASRPQNAATTEQPLSEIIVTARRMEERLQDVPISITVFNQQQLNNRNVVQAQDLATYTPSLSANTNFGSENTAFAIRGFVQDNGTQPSVGIYFADVVEPRAASDNIPAGDGAGPGDFFDLQNVQVLKGPQGTLFGRNTTGGAVLLVPQRPTAKTEGYLEVSGGNYDMNRIQGVFNTPVGDKLRLRIGIDHEARDGYAKNDTGIGPDNFDDIDYTALRASAIYDITPNVENYLIGSYLRSDTNGNDQKLVGCLPSTGLNAIAAFVDVLGEAACAQLAREQAKGAGFYTVQNAPLTNPETLLTTWRLIDTTTWRAADNLTVKNIFSYAQLKEDLLNPIFGTDFDLADTAVAGLFGFKPGTIVDFAYSAPLPGGDTAYQSTLTEEAQVQGKAFNNRLQYQGGVYFEASDPVGDLIGSQSPVLLNCSDLAHLICANPTGGGDVNYTLGRTTFRDEGVYTQGTYALTSQLKITGGFRYTWDSVRSDSVLKSYTFATGTTQGSSTGFTCNDPSFAAVGCASTLKQNSSAPTGTVDLDYKPIEDVLLYAKYSRGYRAGGVTPQAPAPYNVFQPEHVNTYELGAKTTFLAPIRGTFDVTGFFNNLDNQQLQAGLVPNSSGLSPASAPINAGQSRIDGIEVETTLNLFEGFTLDASYTYLDTDLEKVATIASTGATAYRVTFPAVAGDPLTLSPKNKFSLTAAYVLPVDSNLGRITVSTTFTHTDRQLSNYDDTAPTTEITLGGAVLQTVPTPANIQSLAYLQAENLLNLNLNWIGVARSNFDLSMFATNVTNDKYYSYVPPLFPATFFQTAQLGEPRMYGVRVRYHFGG